MERPKYNGRAHIICAMSPPPTRGFADRSIILVLAAALAAGLGLYFAQRLFAPSSSPAATSQATLSAVRLIAPPRALVAWQLVASDGSALTPASLRGHWTVVFLGFTHCPDVCPTTLAELAKAQKSWSTIAQAVRPRLLFASVDPERDTPRKVGDYAHFFHADTLAASGTPKQVEQFAHSLGLVYMKVPLENGDYTMDHSATLIVLDPQGRQAGLIRPPLDWKAIAADLRTLSGAGQ